VIVSARPLLPDTPQEAGVKAVLLKPFDLRVPSTADRHRAMKPWPSKDRHLQVQQDRVTSRGAHALEPLRPVARLVHDVAVAAQRLGHDGAKRGLVIHKQDPPRPDQLGLITAAAKARFVTDGCTPHQVRRRSVGYARRRDNRAAKLTGAQRRGGRSAEAAWLHERRRPIPVIMFTSHAADVAEGKLGETERSRKAAFVGFVDKPFDIDVLVDAVKRAVAEPAAVLDLRPSASR